MSDTSRFGFELPKDKASRDRLAELGQLAGGLVHEIKNPLGAIDLNVEMLLKQCRDGKFDAQRMITRLERIKASSRHLGDIAQAYLAFARPGDPDPDRVDVNALIRNLLDEQQAVFDEAHITVSFRAEQHLAAVPADPTHLRSAFLNILLNARDALLERDDNRILIVATRNRGDGIVVVFANNGPPLSANAAAHLFDPFFSDKEGGTGLGLAIVSRLVELHRGRVAVHSTPQQVVFSVELPTDLGPAQPFTELPIPAKEVAAIVRNDDFPGDPKVATDASN